MQMNYDEQDLNVIRMSGQLKNDADNDQSMFFARELNHIKAQTYDVKVPENNAMKIFPVATDTNPGAKTITFQSFDSVGMADIIANYADDLKRADVVGTEETIKIYAIGNAYGYSTDDIRAAQMTGRPLPAMKALAARRAHDALINKLAFKGDKAHNIIGIIDHPNISEYVVPNTGEGSKTEWKYKSADQILDDMNAMAALPVDVTEGVEIPDSMALALDCYNIIATKKVPDANGKTVLKYFLETNPYVKNVHPVHELKGAGSEGKNVGLVYRKDKAALELNLPLAFIQYAPQMKNLEYVIPCESKTAGIIVFYPLSICKAVGI